MIVAGSEDSQLNAGSFTDLIVLVEERKAVVRARGTGSWGTVNMWKKYRDREAFSCGANHFEGEPQVLRLNSRLNVLVSFVEGDGESAAENIQKWFQKGLSVASGMPV